MNVYLKVLLFLLFTVLCFGYEMMDWPFCGKVNLYFNI